MPRVCFILVAGLTDTLLRRNPSAATLCAFGHQQPVRPALPAVTSTAQATLTTGRLVRGHGIICNGLYTHGRRELQNLLDLSSFAAARQQVSFWEQSNRLLDAPRFWKGSHHSATMLFWQQSMDGAADVVLTPKPTHTPDGKTLTACWSSPAGLYPKLVAELGPFPLQNYWGPMANLNSSQWIIRAAELVWQWHPTDIQLVYVPHLDYNLQRLGPDDPAIDKDVQDVDALLKRLVEKVRGDGGIPVVAGDYAITPVRRAVLPNLALRREKLLHTRPDDAGKLLVDFDAGNAFAMVDHQIAHVYCNGGGCIPAAGRVLASLPGVQRVLSLPDQFHEAGLDHGRCGDLVLLASPDTWFAHDWWENDQEKPSWQFSVDIHNKPGYDPRELFFDPVNKRIAQDPALVKGSHGLASPDAKDHPVLLCDPAVAPAIPDAAAMSLAFWLDGLLGK